MLKSRNKKAFIFHYIPASHFRLAKIISRRFSGKTDSQSQNSPAQKLPANSPYPYLVTAIKVGTPLLPGTIKLGNKDIQQNSDSAKEYAYFLAKREGDKSKVKSLDEIHTVGTYATVSNFPGLNLDQHNQISLGENLIKKISVRKTVKALHVERGKVFLGSYGDEEIYTLPARMMSVIIRKKFLALRRELFIINETIKRESPDMKYVEGQKNMETVEQIRNFVGMLFPNEPIGLQRILEKKSVSSSIDEMMAFVTEQSIKLKVSTNASKSLMSNYIENHKRAYYKKMIDEINKEIGDAKPDKFIDKYVSGITEKMPENVRDVIKEEIEKLKMVGQSHAESESIRNYLDWMIAIPWGKYSEDNLNLAKAKKVMEEDHYGLKDVKDRIIEFIATAILRKSVAKGKILCFVGPPGVGKTSMGRSIARALNRSFVMLSVGGMTDQHEIKGHRRTYVSAMPGKVARLLKQAKTANPLIMIDEIDKIGHNSYRSNVSATLLELLDTNQNHEFMDNFMDVPLDLSKALFVCTANDGSAIEPVLADRMEFITLSGYTHQEKRCIAERYLIPKVLSDTGILLKQCSVTNEALDYILRWHCREAGVRNLDRALQKIFRKVAVKLVKEGDKANDGETIVVEANDVSGYLGKKKFQRDRLYENTPIGVATGLSVSEYSGGTTLYIETEVIGKLKNDKTNYHATGSLGKVMSESISIAFSVAKTHLKNMLKENHLTNKNLSDDDLNKNNNIEKVKENFFEENYIHIHFPEGSIPKDGPSAGVAMVTALISLATKKTVKKDMAMTGEISLVGNVLPVGGIKEKVLGAKLSLMKEVILPKENMADWEEMDDVVKKDIKPYFVESVAEVLKIAF